MKLNTVKDTDCYLVIDVGGTFIKYALMDGTTAILEKDEVPTPLTGLEDYLQTLETIYRRYEGQVCGIAMSAPGAIDSDRGYFYTGGNLQEFIHDINLQELLEARCGVPVRIENDAKCAALAEAWTGSLKDCRDGVVIVLGTGVGGGIIKDGRVHKGKNFTAGELSFLIVGDDLEDDRSYMANLCGAGGLKQLAAKAMDADPETLDGRMIFERANAGDKAVIEAIDAFTKPLARLIYNIQIFYDPEKVAIGGGISRQPLLLELIRKNLDYIYDNMAYPVVMGQKAEVVCCRYLSDSNLVGALRHFMTSMSHAD
ncbi:MAG: ROK family protein [Lachnospiraceae bacterium]|nr:ROK family protein [Lachnospiraceae bacterium]MDY4968774.1 ROK family protein [Lachnospiraceae bacterium]